MQISGQIVPGGNTVLRLVGAHQLSREARRRLQWIDFYEHHERNARLTCRHFGISSATFYRWWYRYDPRRLASLEDDRRTRRPHRVRQPQTAPALVTRIRALREQYPRWGKLKLAVLLRQDGWAVSASTVGRTLTRLRRLGQLVEPAAVRGTRRGRRRAPRLYARRKPWDYIPQRPSDLVELDATPIEVIPALPKASTSSSCHLAVPISMATSNAPIARTRMSSMTSQRSPRSSPNIGGSCAPGRTPTTTSVPTRLWAISPRMNSSVASIDDERGKVFRIYWTSTYPVMGQ